MQDVWLRVQRWFVNRKPRVINSDLLAWCRTHGADFQRFESFPKYTRRLPRTVEPEISIEYAKRIEGLGVSKYLAVIRNAVFTGKRGLVILPDRQYVMDSAFTPDQIRQDLSYKFPPLQTEFKSGKYFSLVNAWNHKYYHWTHDSLLRLFQVQDVLPKDILYIVPSDLLDWHKVTLRVMGISPEQTVPFDATRHWKLEQLYFTNLTCWSGHHHPAPDLWLREKYLNYFGIRELQTRLRLYVSRNKMSKRHVTNEDQVLALLEPLGFQTVYPESLSIAEQVQLFSQSDVVVGSHGSAFTNLYFAPPGVKLVDIVESSMDKFRYIFWGLCEALGHEYLYFDADSVPSGTDRPDVHIPLEKLARALDSLGIGDAQESVRSV